MTGEEILQLKALASVLDASFRGAQFGGLKMSNAIIALSHLLQEVDNLADALAFMDRVRGSTLGEQIAVGRDHYEWVEKAAREVAGFR